MPCMRDTHTLQDVGKSLYTGTLACVASANSVTVQKLSLAFDLGSILSNNIQCLCTTISEHYHSRELSQVIPPETRRLMSLAIAFAGTIKGLLIVNTLLPKMSLRISSSALGAYWATEVSKKKRQKGREKWSLLMTLFFFPRRP